MYSVDEHTLAAFLAGTLTETRRREVAAYLDGDPEARDVLRMASEALQAARSEEPAGRSSLVARTPALQRAQRSAQRSVQHSAQRSALPAVRSNIRGAGLYASAASFVFGVGLVLWFALGPPLEAFRPPPLPDHARLSVELSYPGPTIAWQPVEEAFRYRLVVWDQRRADVAGSYRTTDHELGSSHEIIQALREDLQTGRTYVLRVDAIDARNRRVQSSATVEFVAE
jgi:hypothetical protein